MTPRPCLPTELLTHIFTYAAANLDTEHITKTIGLASKSFRNIIKASGIDVLYVSIQGTNNINAFFKLLQGREMVQKRVRSLLVVVDEYEDHGAFHDPLIFLLNDHTVIQKTTF